MSHNTNKLFWLSALAIVIVVACMAVYNNVTDPTHTLYNNNNQESLCNALYRDKLVSCLDASSNSELGQHDKITTWYDQTSKLNGTLINFDFNEKSGWEETSLHFDGIDDKLIIDTTEIKNEEVSLLLNLKLENLPSTKSLLINHNNLKVYINPNGSIELESFNGSLVSTATLEENAWYSIMLTYKDGLFKLFLNGQQDSKSTTVNSDAKILDLTNNIEIGSNIKMFLSSFAIWDNELDNNNINQNISALNNKTLDIEKYYVSFDYTGTCQEWLAPRDGKYQIELWGAQGNSNNNLGGKGAYTSGNIDLKKDTKLYICVGSGGNNTGTNFNGGGSGTYAGGGATDVRLDYNNNEKTFNSLKSRIMVAAGGGAGFNAQGGAGGNLMGGNGDIENIGVLAPTGGNQEYGGNKAIKKDSFGQEVDIYTNGSNGSFGQGGNVATGAGGGGGYYGGGSISTEGGAAGGSSYISGYPGMISLNANSRSDKLLYTDEKHYSGYIFESTYVVNGTTEIIDPITKEVTIGKSGNGYAKISYVENQESIADKEPISTEYKVPGKPIKLEENITYNSNSIKFDEVPDGKVYKCLFGTDENLTNDGIITTVIGQTQVCQLNNLSQNTKYYYKLIAINGDKETSSDIYEFTTQYKTPNKATLANTALEYDNVNITFNIDNVSTDYICHLGTSEGNLNITGVYEINDNKLTCKFDNLNQNQEYFTTLETINGDKKSTSDVIKIATDYKKPEKVYLTNTVISTNSIMAEFSGLDYYSDIKCYIGDNLDDISTEMEVLVEKDKIYCSSDNLIQGKNYYIKADVINYTKNTESEIERIKTYYAAPELPELVSETILDTSIERVFDISVNSVLDEVTYTCSYGIDKDNLDNTGIVTLNAGNTLTCSYIGLDENTPYYTRLNIINGDKVEYTEVKLITTDYKKTIKPTYISSAIIDSNNITATYSIDNENYDFTCYASLTSGGKDIISRPNINDRVAECNFNSLEGGKYYFYLYEKNGKYDTASDIKSKDIDIVLPELTITADSSQFNTKGWAKNNINVNVQGGSIIKGQLQGIAMCEAQSNCTPSISTEIELDQTTHTSTDSNTRILELTDTIEGTVNTTVTISNESDSNYLCFAPLLRNGMGNVECYGPYKLDKTAPVIRMAGGTVVVSNSTNSLDLYSGITIDSDLSGVNKTYTNAPTWKTIGEYIVNYTFTDNAGNVTTARRIYDIISGTATQVDTAEKVFGTGNNYYFAKFSSTVSGAHMSPRMYLNGSKINSLPTFPKAGYTLNGFYRENTYSNQVTTNTTYNYGQDITLYAKTTLITYNISYNYNSGSATNNTTYNVETNNFTLNNPTRNYYDFVGWSGTGLSGNNNTSVTVSKGSTGDRSYTANWTPTNYTITYTLNGGSISGQKTSYNVETAAFTLPTPTRSYYTFKGWSGTGLSGSSNTSVTVAKGSNGNRSYTANWTPVSYSISYNYNGGSASNPGSYTVESARFCLNNPSKAGWSFNGWSGSGSGSSVCINQGSTGNKNYTASWVDNIAPVITGMSFSEQGNAWNYNTGKHWRTTISVVEQGSGIKNVHYWGVGFNNNGEDWPNTTTAWDGFNGVTFGSSQMCAQVEDNAGNVSNQYCKVITG